MLNHAGDVMSANMAMEMADKEGINYKMLLTHEDIAPGANAPAEDRRGLVGCIPLYKIAGAAAEAGKSLDEVHAIASRFNDNMATLAVAMKTATHPASGQTIFELADDEMEIGMGQHGEAGTGPCKILTADQTAEMMLLAPRRRREGQGRATACCSSSTAAAPPRSWRCTSCCAAARSTSTRQGISHRRGPLRRVAHRPGNGRLPDVRRQDG